MHHFIDFPGNGLGLVADVDCLDLQVTPSGTGRRDGWDSCCLHAPSRHALGWMRVLGVGPVDSHPSGEGARTV